MSSSLEIIVELDSAMTDLERRERELAGVPVWMEELHAEHSAQQSEVEAVREERDRAEAERRATESEADAGKAKLEHYQEQVRQVRTQREYSALLQEIDTVKEAINAAEETSLELMQQQEAAESALEEAEAGFSDLDQRYQEALEQWEEQKPEAQQKAAELRQRVDSLREELPRSLLSRYERTRERQGGSALAPVRRLERSAGNALFTCEECSYQVRPQSVVVIRRALEGNLEEVVMCDGCGRILYLEEVTA